MINKGFTLIELMIVVAIIGILSMIAMPAYDDYTKRTYVAEGLQLATPMKTAIVEYYADHGQLPTSTQDLGTMNWKWESELWPGTSGNRQLVVLGGKKATSTALYAKTIYIYFDPSLQDYEDSLNHPIEIPITPHIRDGSIQWFCGVDAYKRSAKGELDVPVLTRPRINALKIRYMPANCR